MDPVAWSPLLLGALASLAAGLATGLGGVPVLFGRRLAAAKEDALLGFAAGVMLAAAFFSLINPALAAAGGRGYGPMGAALVVVAAILSGAICLWLLNRVLPHEHFVTGRAGMGGEAVRRIWLFVLAITLHNFPEGLAVGVGFGGGDVAAGTALALAIGLQNIPEGMAVAVALAGLGYTPREAAWVALLTGLVEPVGGLIGAGAVTISAAVLPWGMGFAAGAMLWVISNEIIPETHRKGHEDIATLGLMAGLAVMMLLDVSLG